MGIRVDSATVVDRVKMEDCSRHSKTGQGL